MGNGLLFSPANRGACPCPLLACGCILGSRGPAGHGEEELVMSGIDRQQEVDHLVSGHQRLWLASPLPLKLESELISTGS